MLLPSRAHEVALAVDAVARAHGGYIWTAPVGTGKSALLELTLDELATRAALVPHVVVHLTARSPAAAHQRPGVEPAWATGPGDLSRSPRSVAPAASAAGDLGAATDALVGQLERSSGVPAPGYLRRFTSGTDDAHAGPEATCTALARYVREALPGTTLVLIVDDIDDLDDATRTLALDLVAHHQIRAVLLGAAAHAGWDAPLPYPIAVRKLPPLSAQETLHLLTHEHRRESGSRTPTGTAVVGVSPVVAGALTQQLGGNTSCILQTAAELTPAQLAGTSILPNPLPAVPALAELHGPALACLSTRDRRSLLIASVTVTDRLDVLLAAAATTMDEVVTTPLADLLHFVGGRFSFVHPGVRALVHAEASVADRTEAHGALAQPLLSAGMQDAAAWHRALASLAGDPRVCSDLSLIAERLIDRGDVVHAHEVAREAACQGAGRDRAVAERLAGIAALRSGHVGDAVDWLRAAMRSGDQTIAACALPSYVVAVAALHGQVPDDDITQLIEDYEAALSDPVVSDGIVRALAISGRLHAERGESDLAVIALEAARSLALACATTSDSTTDVVAVELSWASMFTAFTLDERAPTTSPRSPDRQTYVSTGRALQLALSGDLDGAARLLTHAVASLSPLHDGEVWWAVSERAASPFAEAHLRVAKALVDMWNEDFSRAAHELHSAAFRLPVTLPFAGLGVAAARRLSVLRTGTLDDVATALDAVSTASPALPVRIEASIDQAMLTALEQWPDDPAHRAPSTEGGAPLLPRQHPTRFPALPGLPDVGRPLAPAAPSTYLRAHDELAAGRTLARAGAHERALDHLRSSCDLFSLTGAQAWSQRAATEAVRLAAATATTTTAATATSTPETLDLHERWGALLTRRELDVALLVVQGASNRDVAQALHLSVRTVEVHLSRVFRKTGTRSRVALTVLAHAAD